MNINWVDFWILWLLIVSATWRRGDIKILLYMSAPVRKSLVSNDHGRTHKCDSSVSDWKYPFWANLVKAIKTVSVSRNLVLILIRIRRIQWWCSLFLFWLGIPFLRKLGPKNQNRQFKMKFGTLTNSNMQNSMVVFTFSVLDQKHTFWVNLFQKIKIVSLSWNLVPRLIRVCRIQW